MDPIFLVSGYNTRTGRLIAFAYVNRADAEERARRIEGRHPGEVNIEVFERAVQPAIEEE